MYDGFRFIFSGVEPDQYFDMVSKETNNMLMSYYWIQRKGQKFIDARKKQAPEMKLMLDSGAHTFLDDKARDQWGSKPIEYWEAYLEKYCKWILRNKDIVFSVVELDIQALVGQEVVDKWRNTFFKKLEDEGIQVIYVWHGTRPDKEWEELCKRFSYVGFSMNNTSLSMMEISKMFASARRYKARIHGFASTGGEMLMKFPFYSADSTTFLIGSKYGEINYFDGRKMTRLKKPQWKRQYKQKLIKKGLSWKLLEREDPNEMIRASMLTFLELEAHVKRIMSKKWYWLSEAKGATLSKASSLSLVISNATTKEEERGSTMAEEKPKKKKIMLKKSKKTQPVIEDVKEATEEQGYFEAMPSYDWIVAGGDEEWQRYCSVFNLPTTLTKEVAMSWFYYFYCFLTGEHLNEIATESMYEIADIFKIPKEQCRSRVMAIDLLTTILQDHADGKRKDLLEQEEASEDEATVAEMPKERDGVEDDNEFELVEMTPVQIHSYLATLLPAEADIGMPEVQAEADRVLADKGVVTTRDEGGRFVGGQKAVRKPKKLLTSRSMPRLSCSNCYASQNCPKYAPGYVCAYNKIFHKFDSRKTEDIMDALGAITEEALARAQRQLFFEELDGGMADDNTSKLMDTAFKYLQTMHSLQNPKAALQHVRVTPGGAVEQTTVSASEGGGILEKLFANLPSVQKRVSEEEARETINVTPKEVDK